MRLISALAALAMVSFTPGTVSARDIEPAQRVLVQGTASIERPAEWARLSMIVRGEGATQIEALRQVAATRELIEQGLLRIDGLDRARFETGNIDIVELRGPECRTRDSRGSFEVLTQGECAIVGAVATLQLTVTLSDASRVGEAAGYATQLGAKHVNLAGSGLFDNAGLREEALRAAVANARKEATAIAEAAGLRLGPLIQAQDADSFRVNTIGSEQLELTATMTTDTLLGELPQIIPVDLDLTVPPVKASARVTASFGLAK